MSPLCALALELGAGALIAERLAARGGTRRGERALWVLALAPGFGAGVASLLFVGHRALGLPPPGPWLFALESALLGVLPAALGARGAAPARAPRTPAAARVLAGAALLLATVLAARVALAFWSAVPLGAWDAVATWTLRARLLFGSGADWVTALDATNYPLLLPGAVAAAWTWVGEPSMTIPKGLGVAFAASPVLLLPLALGARGRALGLAAAALLLATPTFLNQGFAQEADVPVAALLLAALAALAARLRGVAAPPAELAGLALGLLAWTKNEGVLWALLALVAYAVAGGRRALGDLPRLAAGAAPGLLAWALFKLLAAPSQGLGAASYLAGEWSARLLSFERWRTVVEAVARRFDPWQSGFGWGLVWTLVAAAATLAALAGAHRSDATERAVSSGAPGQAERRLWSTFVAGYLVALVPLYVLTPLSLEWHLSTSLDRLLLQLLPSALAATAVWIGGLVDSAAAGSPAAVSSRI